MKKIKVFIIFSINLLLFTNFSYSARNPGVDCQSDDDCIKTYGQNYTCLSPASGGTGKCVNEYSTC